MEDLSLDDLLAELQDVQERKPATKLSERNVVELISKLRELGLLGDDLLHSINGREYITASQLCSEVRQTVEQTGGRVAVVDLPAQLGVDITHCERQAQEAVEQSSGALRLIQGEILSTSYFDSVAAEINELLQESGSLAISEIAKRFKLSAELVLSNVSPRLDSVIQGRLESGMLYTSLYFAQIKAQLRGALRGAICPVNVAALIKKWDLPATSNTSQAVISLVEELVAEKAVSGSLKPGTSIFTPALYAVAQQKASHSFYEQNAYIEYTMLERMGFPDGKAAIAREFPDGIALQSVFVAPQLKAQLDAALEEAVTSDSWADAQASLPSAVPASDAAVLLQECIALRSEDRTALRPVAGTCAVTAALTEDLLQKALGVAQEVAQAELKRRRASAATASSSAPSVVPGDRPGKAKAEPVDDPNLSDDEWDTSKSRKKKAGRRKGRGGGGGGGGGGPPAKSNKALKPHKEESGASSNLLSVAALTALVEEWLPEAVGAGEAGSFTEALAAELRDPALQEYEKTLATVFLAGAESRRRQREAIGKLVEERMQRLQLYSHGAELARSDAATHAALQRHLLRGLGQQLLDLLLRLHEVELREDQSGGQPMSQPQAMAPLTLGERSQIMGALPADVRSGMAAAEKSLTGSELRAAEEALQAAALEAGVAVKQLDKKLEKALVQEHRAALSERLREEEQAAEALSLAIPLLIAQVYGVALSIPGKALAGAIGLLTDKLEPDAFQQLSGFHSSVVQHLRSPTEGQGSKLAEVLPAIKQLAGIQPS